MIDLTQQQRELASLNRQRAANLGAASPSQLPVALKLGLALAIGARVLDLVTGEIGVIIDGNVEHIILSPAGQ